MNELLDRLQDIAHKLRISGKPEMSRTVLEAVEVLRAEHEQIKKETRELRLKAVAIDRALDLLENAWEDPGLYGEGDT